jgi:hypothetical protein
MKKSLVFSFILFINLMFSCTVFAAFFINFENGTEGARINDIPGISFETFNGYTPLYYDLRTAGHNATSDDLGTSNGTGAYHINGNHCLWGSAEADARGVKIDFTKNNGTYFRTGYSSSSNFYLEAYYTDGTSSSVVGSQNLYNPMAYLEINAPANKFIDYVVLHDTGNYWLVDDMSGDSSANKHNFWGIFIGQDFTDNIPRGALIAKEIYDKCFFIQNDRRRLIINNGNSQVTKSRIEEAINEFKSQMNEGDTLFIYLVGHGGTRINEMDETTLSAGDEYAVLNDIDNSDDVKYLTDDDLKSMLEPKDGDNVNMNKVNKWIFLDFCHSGGFWGDNNSGDTGDLEKLQNICMMAASIEIGWASSVPYYGFDNPEVGKPLFGIHLRNGLTLDSNNHAYCDRSPEDGIVTFDELKYWMKSHVDDLYFIDGLTVRQMDSGDSVIFSIDDWNPIVEKTEDFAGALCTISSNEPRANIENSQGYVGEPILFDASNSSSPYGGIIKYEWDWDGDGVYDEETINPTIEHTFSNIYEGIVILRITDIENYNDTTSISINVLENQATVAEADDNGGGGSGGCFISASSPNGPAALEYLFFAIVGLLLFGIERLCRKHLSR